ncbi:MAG: hypothetical protein AAF682_26335 [Planctomycetota bacterium]
MRLLPALLLSALAASCATIPAVDSVAPRIELRISGPGVGSKLMSNPPRETWEGEGGSQYLNLRPNTEYNFTVIVTDQGGVERAHLALPDTLALSNLSGEGLEVVDDGIVTRLTVRGDRSDPSRILAFSGRFDTSGNSGVGFTFAGESDDFGGTSGTSNQTFLVVNAFVGL